ncbi:MAG: hypothetical protein MJZ34_02690 [Paludibacteraceae bacterium]|nr:hypothetical protein [Paludibacteraceae bacterium]
MKFEGTKVFGFEAAAVGMRLPMNLSYTDAQNKADTSISDIGEDDCRVMGKLIHADHTYNSNPNSKFLRMVHVQVCITAPVYWWAEFDTYKIGVVRNSSSFMHKGTSREFTLDDFEIDTESLDDSSLNNAPFADYWRTTIYDLNLVRSKYLETKDMKYFRQLRQMIPSSYLYTSMIDFNYAVIRNIIQQRKNHRLKEWKVDFMDWCKQLPYAEELLFKGREL